MKGVNQTTNLQPYVTPYVTAPGETTSETKLKDVMFTSSSTAETEVADLAAALKNKAQTTKGLNPRQMAAYDKQMLAAVQDTKPLLISDADRLTVAAVVPGALGVLQPSGPDQATVGKQDAQLQDAMQKQTQAMQTLSALMKSMHDTAKAIINNMRG